MTKRALSFSAIAIVVLFVVSCTPIRPPDPGNDAGAMDASIQAEDASSRDVGPPRDGCPAPMPEVCNGEDDDCNPVTPDGLDDALVGEPCDGPDADMCAEGVGLCTDGRIACNDVSDDSVEICNDMDDDCDGRVDEDVSTAAETCNAIDDDCDSMVDEGDVCAPCVPGTFDGHQYLFCPERLAWGAARTACGASGYDDLAVIASRSENTYVAMMTQSVQISETWWLGWMGQVPFTSGCICGTDCLGHTVGDWVDGNAFSFMDWGIAQPCQEQPACLTMDHTMSGWAMWNCATQQLYYVCETADP